ncbi:carbohydrate kinase [Streptomyces sp. SID8361]|uniref:carbohydrate kinase family protein n=1 Tax=Streptomyces TaxID=1883 RepID=UPI00081F4430|nr:MULTISPECIES: carbohydrate kinase [unclassified Streptomyces]AUA17213.1 5-dehydro-2-deoxygluconokinase [Streptomyces sp. M56]MYU14503.1 carbohydrate kinase [Streptomyces sp. SID8361]MYX63446.1 carbohydrate kinase [Streptomyces sp. SID8382]SCG06212.1 fructokinase [Streptomyces sp. MnatMP-M27]
MTQKAATCGQARVTVVGEVLVDLLWRAGTRLIAPAVGGSPANVAVGLRRLGRPATLVTTWGEDLPGRQIAAHLDASGLDVVRVPSGTGRSTVALAYLDDNGSATYDFLASWGPERLEVPAGTAVLHTGSLAAVLEPGAREVLRLCEQASASKDCTVVVDLNVRPAVQPDRDAYRAACLRMAAVANVVKASDEDLAWLFPGTTPAAAARLLADCGPELVVVTLGSAGALGVTADEEVRVPARKVAVVDTVGAGDAFQAALLDAIASRSGPLADNPAGRRPLLPATAEEIRAVLARCVAAAAITCTRAGANPPTAAELNAALGA